MPPTDPEVAAQAAMLNARRKVGHAQAQLRKATGALAQATESVEQYGTHECTTPADADKVRDLVLLGLAEHEEVDVVLLIPSPTARARRERRSR